MAGEPSASERSTIRRADASRRTFSSFERMRSRMTASPSSPASAPISWRALAIAWSQYTR